MGKRSHTIGKTTPKYHITNTAQPSPQAQQPSFSPTDLQLHREGGDHQEKDGLTSHRCSETPLAQLSSAAGLQPLLPGASNVPAPAEVQWLQVLLPVTFYLTGEENL